MNRINTRKAFLIVTKLLFCVSNSLFAQNQAATIDNKVVAAVIQKANTEDPVLANKLKEIYQTTKRFKDVKVALEEGSLRDPFNLCDTGRMMGWQQLVGAMGLHYVRPDLLGLTPGTERVDGNGLHTDFTQPGILIYEPMEDGSMKLVVIEN